MSKSGFGKLMLGAAIGGALGVLFAPKKGSESRKELKRAALETVDRLKNTDYDEVKKNVEAEVKRLMKEIKALDKEKVVSIVKQKGSELIDKANDIVDYAVAKGTPVVEKAAKDARTKAISILTETIKSLEEANKKASSTKTTKKTTKKASK